MRSATIPYSLNGTETVKLPIDTLLWTDECDITAFAEICYTDDALLVKLTANEKNVRAEETGLLGMPCLDSCLEFFFAPVEGDLRYFNFEYNPNGCIYLGIGTGRGDSTRLVLSDPAKLFTPEIVRSADGWSVAYRVPFAFIRRFFPDFKAVSGGKMRANFFKCGDLTVKEHYFSWNPVEVETPDFHLPAWFGELVFG